MAATKEGPRTCEDCGGTYIGNSASRRCATCLVQRERLRMRKGKKPVVLTDKVCLACGKDYRGTRSEKACPECRIAAKRERHSRSMARLYQRTKALRATRPASSVPPPCQRCHYCRETDQYPSGMVCLAEAFMRCQPWNLGAKPLKERENV